MCILLDTGQVAPSSTLFLKPPDGLPQDTATEWMYTGKAANIRHSRAFLKVLPLTDGM